MSVVAKLQSYFDGALAADNFSYQDYQTCHLRLEKGDEEVIAADFPSQLRIRFEWPIGQNKAERWKLTLYIHTLYKQYAILFGWGWEN